VLRGILPNINGPPSLARRLYYNVWDSIVMYGAPVCAGAVNLAKNRRAIKRAQRTALIITSTTYRTVSHAALCVLTGNMPIYIKVKMLKESYEKSRIYKRMVVEDDGSGNVNTWKDELELISRRSYEGWQTECNGYNKDNITKKLIRNVSIFAKKEGY
jgi:hypothetical protein